MKDLVNAGNTNRYLFTPFHYVVDTSLQIDAEMTILAKTMRKETVRINGNRLTIEPDTLYRFTPIGTITAPLYFSWDELVKLPGRTYFLTAPMPESTLSKVSSLEATVSDYGLTLSKPNDYVTRDRVVNNAVGIRKLPVTEKQVAEEGSYATGGRTQLSFDELNGEYDAGYINPLKSFSIKMLLDLDVSAFPADEYTFSLRDFMAKNLVSGEIRMDVYTTIGPPTALIQVVNQSIRCTIPSIYSNTWTEIHHTHSRDVYDPNTMTRTFTNKFFYARVWNKPSKVMQYSVKDENDTLLGQNTFVDWELTSVPSTPSQILAIRIPQVLWITETQSPISPVTTNAFIQYPIEIRVLPYGTVDNPAFIRKVVIPRDTIFTVSGYNFALLLLDVDSLLAKAMPLNVAGRHMSDVDYVDVFAQPSQATFDRDTIPKMFPSMAQTHDDLFDPVVYMTEVGITMGHTIIQGLNQLQDVQDADGQILLRDPTALSKDLLLMAHNPSAMQSLIRLPIHP
ncbi:hypothetical protein SPFM14_00233 [Salmonella phage SPFM14]|nr:hypothetical protein SPFM14_00233 [Salmonella phage SPFM14]